MNEETFSPDLPDFNEDAVRHEEDTSQYTDMNFSHVLIQNTPFIGKTFHTGPLSKIDDGFNDIII